MGNGLPSFSKPPVVEVILGAQFKPLSGLRTSNVAHVLDIFKNDFEHIEEKEPLPSLQEKLTHGTASRNLFFSIQTVPSMPRYWLTDATNNHLLQLQQNRFLRNWKSFETVDSVEYPRYPTLKTKFKSDYEKFSKFISEKNLGEIDLEYVEITYVNYIYSSHNYNNPFLKPFALNYSSKNIPALEEADLSLRYLIPDSTGTIVGRFYIELEPRFKDGKELYQLTLTVRGKPTSNNLEGILTFLDLGHETIVQGFEAVTNESWHIKWEKQ